MPKKSDYLHHISYICQTWCWIELKMPRIVYLFVSRVCCSFCHPASMHTSWWWVWMVGASCYSLSFYSVSVFNNYTFPPTLQTYSPLHNTHHFLDQNKWAGSGPAGSCAGPSCSWLRWSWFSVWQRRWGLDRVSEDRIQSPHSSSLEQQSRSPGSAVWGQGVRVKAGGYTNFIRFFFILQGFIKDKPSWQVKLWWILNLWA